MKVNVRTMTTTALLVAASVAVSYFEIPIIAAFPFLKLDFSMVPLILCTMLLGLLPGICAQVLSAVIALLVTGSASAGVGTTFNMVLGILFTLLYCGSCRMLKCRFRTWLALAIAAVLCIVLAGILNFIGVVPIYKAIGMVPQDFDAVYFVLAGALPLNLVKWPLNALLAGVVYQGVKRYLK